MFPTTLFWLAIAAVAAYSRSPFALVTTFCVGCVIEAALVLLLAHGSARRARAASIIAAASWVVFALAFATYGFTFLSFTGLFAGIATLLTVAYTFEREDYIVGGLLPAIYFIADRGVSSAGQILYELHRSAQVTPGIAYFVSSYSWFTFDATVLLIAGLAALFTWVFRRLGLLGPPQNSSSRSVVFFATVAVALAAGSAVKAMLGSAFAVVSGVLTGAAYSFLSRPSTIAASRATSVAVIGTLALLAAFFGAGNGWISWHDWHLAR